MSTFSSFGLAEPGPAGRRLWRSRRFSSPSSTRAILTRRPSISTVVMVSLWAAWLVSHSSMSMSSTASTVAASSSTSTSSTERLSPGRCMVPLLGAGLVVEDAGQGGAEGALLGVPELHRLAAGVVELAVGRADPFEDLAHPLVVAPVDADQGLAKLTNAGGGGVGQVVTSWLQPPRLALGRGPIPCREAGLCHGLLLVVRGLPALCREGGHAPAPRRCSRSGPRSSRARFPRRTCRGPWRAHPWRMSR